MRWRVQVVAFGCLWAAPLAAPPADWERLAASVKQLSQQAKWADALPLAQQALRLAAAFGPQSGQMATSLVDLAAIEEAQGRGIEAIQAYTRAFQIYYKIAGPEDLNTARVGIRAGALMIDGGNLRDGCPTVKTGEQILEKKLGLDDREVAGALVLVGDCLHYDRKNDEAEAAYRRALAIDEKLFGPNDRAVASPLTFLAALYHDQGKFAEADPFYRRALALEERTLGPDNPNTSEAALGLAVNYYAWGKPELAEPLYDLRMKVFAREFASGSGYMSERDRLAFLRSAPGVYPLYFSFVYTNPSRPGLAGKMFDLLISERGITAGLSADLRARLFATGDRQALALFDQLRQEKTELATIAASPADDARRRRLAQLDQEINDVEENLARRAAALAQGRAMPAPAWRDVQRALHPGEAAVEYVRFHFHDGRTFTNTWDYAALVLTPGAEPKLVPLGDAVAAEKTVRDLFATQMSPTRGVSIAAAPAATVGPECYNAFWKPLEPALGGAKRVYVASDGILNQFPMGLFTDSSGRMLMESYDLWQLNSTRDLLRHPVRATARTALLMGNPSFDLTEAQQRAAVSQLGAPGAARSPGATVNPNGKLAALPATQDEVDQLSKTFQSAGWQVRELTGDLALKEALLRQQAPRVLHLATHGFFILSRPNIGLDPLLRSGLFLAGAGRTLAGSPPSAGLENGVLTSYEAAQLNLQGSELVVLSACETGRGDQADGEGVFGLRRALEEAGAQAVVMSSWSVPDRETQELMALFYKKWLAGADKHEALRQAQLEERAVVRQRYGKDLPFYWGAFVMVGR